ncbi:DUF6527 family protein [Bradyrhizobium yuanmingense]|uniref:DUF6527 family protein n=1 Tax=Bradyrhizobium yuanmingense TaxID=108015 RepID=UPI0023B92C35|nr:DUF6527 family protein [Bradyrhizobium yuanmingense]MDF0584179.1 DUF6527 family protein [Bradyrhizobium yuanmingense]
MRWLGHIRETFRDVERRARRWWDRRGPRRRLRVVAGDSLPPRLPHRDLTVARDDGEDWCVGFRCPCGCGHAIELLVIPEARPRWAISTDSEGYPTLSPSVWRNQGCRSHFWVRGGRIIWCE